MCGDPLAHQIKCHNRTQRTPREIFRLLLSFLDIFLTPSHTIRKTIKGFSAKPPLRPWRLGVRGLDGFMHHRFKVIHDELYTFRVRLWAQWAHNVKEKIWHESQKITWLPDGGLEITFRGAGLDEIRGWILGFGPECQVLEPEKLMDIVRKDLHRTLAQYPASRIAFNLVRETRAI